VNTASNSVSSYTIASDGSLTLASTTSLGSPKGAEDARLAPDGQTLWVVDTGAHAISSFSVSGSSVTELSSSPTATPTGSAPFGIVVT